MLSRALTGCAPHRAFSLCCVAPLAHLRLPRTASLQHSQQRAYLRSFAGPVVRGRSAPPLPFSTVPCSSISSRVSGAAAVGGVATVRSVHTTCIVREPSAGEKPAVASSAHATNDTHASPTTPAADTKDSRCTASAGVTDAAAPQPSAAPTAQSAVRDESEPQMDTSGESASASANEKREEEERKKEKEEEQESWWRRQWQSFKSEGKDFSLFYAPFYPATFLLLYAAFATKALHKESILDYVLQWMEGYVDRDKMYARVEAWNTWANLGFAFVINELLEVVRFPVVVVLYYALKPHSTHFANWLRRGMQRFRRSRAKPNASA